MPRTIERPATRSIRPVSPSVVSHATEPFSLDQELKPFGAWNGDPIWVPPKDATAEMAETMLKESWPFASNKKRWSTVVENHRSDFTQVREFDLFQDSIRLPKGKFYVSVTERKDFDKITDNIPNCVQTRLDEFLSGPGKRRGVKVYYLKPLCIEVDDQLILTTQDDLNRAVAKIQEEVFAEYRQRALFRRPLQAVVMACNLALSVPRSIGTYLMERRQKSIDAYHSQLEFKRRMLAYEAAKRHRDCRTDGCTFDDMLTLTNPLRRTDVVEQYCVERELSAAQRANLLQIAAGSMPWFVALSLTISYVSTVAFFATSPLVVCDPAFVAEMPGSGGVVLKIGHFDEVAGVTHVEI